MNTKQIIKKYIILILIYVIFRYLIEPYGFRIYYSVFSEPQMIKETFNTVQSILFLITYLINLVFVIIMFIDSKEKKLIEWLILLITLIRVDIGILLFLMWNIYKRNTNAQQNI